MRLLVLRPGTCQLGVVPGRAAAYLAMTRDNADDYSGVSKLINIAELAG